MLSRLGKNKPSIVLVLGMVLVVLAFTLYLTYTYSLQISLDKTYSSLTSELNSRYSSLNSKLRELERDIRLLSAVPPTKGIVRAEQNDGVDSLDQSTLTLWKQRLSSIFSVYLSVNPDIYQIRFMGVTGQGREIVRVEYGDNHSIHITPEEKLQTKQGRDYFQDIINTSGNAVYFSKINLNREFGQVEVPHRPTIRLATKVYDETSNELYGFIIINYAIQSKFQAMVNSLPENTQLYIMNQQGDFLVHPEQSKTFGFDLDKRYVWQDEFAHQGEIGRAHV